MPAMSSSLPRRRWSTKFRDAMRGVRVGVRGQSSFRVHFSMAGLVMLTAVALNVNLLEWCVLTLCIGTVLGAEMFNSALESLARATTDQYHEDVRDALDAASGAVLLVSVAASVVGATIFIFRLGILLSWWGSYLLI